MVLSSYRTIVETGRAPMARQDSQQLTGAASPRKLNVKMYHSSNGELQQ